MSYGSGPQDDDRSMDFLSKVPRAQGSRGDVDKVCREQPLTRLSLAWQGYRVRQGQTLAMGGRP